MVKFSYREFAVIQCLHIGLSNKIIGAKLGVTEGTVKVHLRTIMRKLGVHNRVQIVLKTTDLIKSARLEVDALEVMMAAQSNSDI